MDDLTLPNIIDMTSTNTNHVRQNQPTTKINLTDYSSKTPISSNGDNTTKPMMSKQLTYYYKHRAKINKDKRQRYRDSKTTNKTHAKNLKPNNYFKPFYPTQDYILEISNRALKAGFDGKISSVKSMFDLLEFARTNIAQAKEDISIHRTKTTSFSTRPAIIIYLGKLGEQNFKSFEYYLKADFPQLSRRQLLRNIQALVKLKWIVRIGRGNFARYSLNPFLEALNDRNDSYLFLGFYSQINIDFFDLLNVPLINVLNSGEKIIKAEVTFQKYTSHALWVRAFFEGHIWIKLYAENGNIYKTIFPVNFHASSKIIGYDSFTEKRITDKYGFPHHTIPLKWSLFGVLESSEFTRKGIDCIYIHFDNSFKILHYKTDRQNVVFRKPFEKLINNIWSTETCQYVEADSSFDTLLARLISLRDSLTAKQEKNYLTLLELDYKTKKHTPKKP